MARAHGLGAGDVAFGPRAAGGFESSSGAEGNELRADEAAGAEDQDLRGHRVRSSVGKRGIEARFLSPARRGEPDNSPGTLHRGVALASGIGLVLAVAVVRGARVQAPAESGLSPHRGRAYAQRFDDDGGDGVSFGGGLRYGREQDNRRFEWWRNHRNAYVARQPVAMEPAAAMIRAARQLAASTARAIVAARPAWGWEQTPARSPPAATPPWAPAPILPRAPIAAPPARATWSGRISATGRGLAPPASRSSVTVASAAARPTATPSASRMAAGAPSTFSVATSTRTATGVASSRSRSARVSRISSASPAIAGSDVERQ